MTRLFGTNGIRGVVGEAMNADLAVKVGRAIGTFFEGGEVGLARDPRLSGPMLARGAASGPAFAGCPCRAPGRGRPTRRRQRLAGAGAGLPGRATRGFAR